MTKSTVIDVKRAWVLQQHLYNSTGTLLASSIAHSHRYYPEYGVSLPQQIEIRLPPAQLALSIDVGTVQLNSLVENPQMWSMPELSVPHIDLGAPATTGNPIPATGSLVLPSTDRGTPGPQAIPFLATTPPLASAPTTSLLASPAIPPNSLSSPRSVYQPTQGPSNAHPPAPPSYQQQPLPQTQQLPAAGLPIR
jgi:hypothetical protein